ncbi:MAG: peptide chain release factor N(5)-glutamine methyltransferase [Phycisphaerales bacterium]|nr:peptide chain release factor N(5)-glutamine methyltransferase [Phycisphaerales bacterium]
MSADAAHAEVWTTRKLLAWMGQAFTKKGLDSPRLMAEMLVAHVIGCDRLKLYLDQDRPASPLERQTLRDLVTRALAHEPVQYLVGDAWFFGLAFHVDRRVLIPRPATETIVEHVLQHARATHGVGARGEGLLIADVCTGSGCVAISLLKRLPGARVVASDLSPDALEVARLNASRHGVLDRLDLLRGDLLAPFAEFPATRGEPSLDYLVANPPYIPDDEWPGQVDRNVLDHEPHLALRGGPDGLTLVRPLIADGARLLKPGGLLLVEVASSRAEEARSLADASPALADARVLQDVEGLPRVVVATRVRR